MEKILVVAGASGVVGKHLCDTAQQEGWSVRVLTRGSRSRFAAGIEPFVWSPASAAHGDKQAVEDVARALEGATALVNLAGSSIADGRLDDAHVRLVLQSRLDSVHAIGAGFLACATPPGCWIQGSAVGYYGSPGNVEVTEESPSGNLILSGVCRDWEGAFLSWLDTVSAPQKPRAVIGRIGLVLAHDAEAWNKMILPIKMGAGGKMGSGRQFYPWIDADDLARALLFLATESSCTGAYNLTAPKPVRQIDMTRKAARKLRRPAIMPAPKAALRLALGRVADELLLPSCRAVPKRLLREGFSFHRADIDAQISFLLR